MRVAGPGVLLVDGRVGDHAVEVALDRPGRVAVDAVERLLARREARRAREARAHLQHARERGRDARGKRLSARPAQLHVLEALVREGGRPPLGARARGDEVVRLQLAVDEVVAPRARPAVLVQLL